MSEEQVVATAPEVKEEKVVVKKYRKQGKKKVCQFCQDKSIVIDYKDANRLRKYITEKGLAGITLSTNKYAPAPHFYSKNGFMNCEHVIFMAKEM